MLAILRFQKVFNTSDRCAKSVRSLPSLCSLLTFEASAGSLLPNVAQVATGQGVCSVHVPILMQYCSNSKHNMLIDLTGEVPRVVIDGVSDKAKEIMVGASYLSLIIQTL